MKRYVALLRAVNVGGTGKLPMSELRQLCEDAGCENVRTYIQSGNVLFSTDAGVRKAKAALENRLEEAVGKHVSVFIRTPSEMRRILDENPFQGREGRYTYVIFLDGPPPKDALEQAVHVNGEEMRLGRRAIYVYYTNGMGRSKLTIPAARKGTARNMNTVAKLAAMGSE